jgi:hypothetical protein
MPANLPAGRTRGKRGEADMKRLAILGTCLLALGAPSGAKPVHKSAPPKHLTSADEAEQRAAEERLNARNPVMLGMTEHWQGETAEGTVRLERIYRDHGQDCHVLEDHFRFGEHGSWRASHPVWCRVADGPWRLREQKR